MEFALSRGDLGGHPLYIAFDERRNQQDAEASFSAYLRAKFCGRLFLKIQSKFIAGSPYWPVCLFWGEFYRLKRQTEGGEMLTRYQGGERTLRKPDQGEKRRKSTGMSLARQRPGIKKMPRYGSTGNTGGLKKSQTNNVLTIRIFIEKERKQ